MAILIIFIASLYRIFEAHKSNRDRLASHAAKVGIKESPVNVRPKYNNTTLNAIYIILLLVASSLIYFHIYINNINFL
ncbi:hypothetical protein [Polluticaenibacter yanchengensis]|uniref:hypothetical protein n=1 Tax=Polluticaenibacter yanchengensis TaxID=3014562 RepID=UPI00387B961A